MIEGFMIKDWSGARNIGDRTEVVIGFGIEAYVIFVIKVFRCI